MISTGGFTQAGGSGDDGPVADACAGSRHAACDPGGRRARPDDPLRELELTAGDLELLTTTADRLYESGRLGAVEAWPNPESGNSRTVEILELFERGDLTCRRVAHVVKIDRDPVPKRLVLASCRVPDRRWLLV